MWKLSFVLGRNPASSQTRGSSRFWSPREHRSPPQPTPPRERFCQTSSPDAKSSPEAVSGALKQRISRVKDERFIPFGTPPSSYSSTDTVYGLSGSEHSQTQNRADSCHAASHLPAVTLHLQIAASRSNTRVQFVIRKRYTCHRVFKIAAARI